jgi:hypothetical protein
MSEPFEAIAALGVDIAENARAAVARAAEIRGRLS